MSFKLNQVIAISGTVKSRKQSTFDATYHQMKKEGIFSGYTKTYVAKDEEGEKLPDDVKIVQLTVDKAIMTARTVLEDMFNIVATQDKGNCLAKADVKIDGNILLKDVPATHLIFLEKELKDINTFIESFPVLDPSEDWAFESANGCFKSKPTETFRTKKIPKSMITAPATDKHPAQVHMYTDDVVIGTYTTTKFSGNMLATRKEKFLDKVRVLIRAVQQAREEANMTEVESVDYGSTVLSYIFD